MLDKVIETLRSKVKYAKDTYHDFVYISVWQAKQIIEHETPLKPRKTISGDICDKCGHKLVNTSYYKQKHCDECGQLIDWEEKK